MPSAATETRRSNSLYKVELAVDLVRFSKVPNRPNGPVSIPFEWAEALVDEIMYLRERVQELGG